MKEQGTLKVVQDFMSLDFNDQDLKDTISIASKVFNAPISMVTLIDEDTVYVRVKQGTKLESYPRKLSFCTQVIKSNRLFVVQDVTPSQAQSESMAFTDIPLIRFYAGAPLITSQGHRIGTLCVVDDKPRTVSGQQKLMLKILSRHIMSVMEAKIRHKELTASYELLNCEREKGRKNEIKLRSLFESMTDVYVYLGLDGNIIDFNRSAFSHIEEHTGKKMNYGSFTADYLTEADNLAFMTNFNYALKGERRQLEMRTYGDPENRIWWDALFEPVSGTNNEIMGVSFTARNITKRKIDEEKIVAQNRLLTQIAEIHSHEYRGPVCSILGMMYLIEQEKYEVDKEYLEMLHVAVKNLDEKTKRVILLINDLKSLDVDK